MSDDETTIPALQLVSLIVPAEFELELPEGAVVVANSLPVLPEEMSAEDWEALGQRHGGAIAQHYQDKAAEALPDDEESDGSEDTAAGQDGEREAA